ncbi:MAG: NAD-dependent epimerase/dehydratase family protein [Candidatus Bipolaricaulia bacterium]
MKVYVTGGTGFIGRHVVNRLVAAGHQVVCLVRSTSRTEALEQAGVTLVVGDISDRSSIHGVRGCDGLVHLAATFELWVPDQKAYYTANVIGIRNVMDAALEAEVRKVVMVSTAMVYGNSTWPVTEETPIGSRRADRYSQSKYAGELVAWQLHQQRGLPLVVIYPAAVLGPDNPKATGRYIRSMAHGRMPAQVVASSPFPFVHVRDVAEAVYAALAKDGNIGAKYLVSSEVMTFEQMNALICDVAGSRPPTIKLPDWATLLLAGFLTALSRITRKPPWLDLSIDQIRLMKTGLVVDASKAVRELGITYTPIRDAIEEELAPAERG